MITMFELVERFEALGEDAVIFQPTETEISLTLVDFEGFDEHWSEIYRDYTDEEAVDALLEWLDETCDFVEGDFYHYYHFGDIVVTLGFTSMDI
jgi:hypothetical protein